MIPIADDERPGAAYIRERLAEVPVGKLLRAAPRTAGFMARSMSRSLRSGSQRYPEIPTRTTTPGMMAAVLADEVVLASMATARLVPDEAALQRISTEVRASVEQFRQQGWIDDPASFHRSPPPPDEPVVRRLSYRRTRYEELSFDSGYEPRAGVAGGQRWLDLTSNRRAYAYVMRHRGEPRPWLVNVHGFSMGKSSDLLAFRSLHFHRDLGFNVIQPVLPLHGPRRMGRRSGEGLATFDYLNNVHGMTQAVWDIRRCMEWARQQGGTSFSAHGVSLGGYAVSLLAALDDTLQAVIAGIPSVDLAWVMRQNVPAEARPLVERYGLLGPDADLVHTVISPLAMACRVPHDRRFIYAGVADRMATPQQALLLWKHWKEPAICWYRGSHVGYVWSGEVRHFVEEALRPDSPGRAGTDRP